MSEELTVRFFAGVSPSGKASGFDPDMRGFESLHPSQCFVRVLNGIESRLLPSIDADFSGSALSEPSLVTRFFHLRPVSKQGNFPCRK